MVEIPHSILDFADAMRLLAESQGDVTELVTKWDELCNTTTPATIKVNVGGVEHEVDNLAKIRQDLISGLSLNTPTVKSLSFKDASRGSSSSGNGMMTAARRYAVLGHSSSQDPFGTDMIVDGYMETVWNMLRTVVCPAASRIDIPLYDIPKVLLLGVPKNTGDTPLDTYDFYITAPGAAYATQDIMAARQYYTTAKFVNRNYGTGNPVVKGNVTIRLHDATGNVNITRVIPPDRYVEYLFFAAPGQDTVNIQEMVPDVP